MKFGHVGRVVIADDEPAVRRGLRTTVESTGEFHVAAADIVLLTGFGLDTDAERALALGADALLPKDTPREELLAALRAVRDGDAVLSPQVLRQVLDASPTPAAARAAGPGAPGPAR
ncbi:hypothetical protein OG311_32470 [Streptomyces sp. NBC_01343]|uniref:hypothetical protein n=1 Tax=Streptomyces sp. NBC_01343 TaxID=2903832 RepID=UPI002E13FC0B|nr:hypothetical protein OG311_32470 [Streptomyces sp. NBC_01343]